ncbi:E3 ubiquitin-protein ligase Topors-like [Centruroides sculpturatus]|uniref:E3 ubiquitin-protein ligase Topors-like n=1 Tax=Centruroides sculpturatus TaxID=218467 RepID=UPI000C6ECC7A|nr:E3 ubiquitin-protein ligase Topors-like [Centruroides sculpturatus]
MMEHKSDHLEDHSVIDRLKSPHATETTDVSPNISKDDDSSSNRSSPDSGCAICLGKLENKSFTDSCFHTFCFTCLLEWSKVKAECPLCKQPFKSIVHNVRSIEDYDQYYINATRTTENSWQSPDGRRFRYPSTLTAERRRHRAFEETLEYRAHRLTYAPHTFSSSHARELTTEHPSTSNFRRHIYENALWVQIGDESQRRYRDTSPEFFCQNPACTHRLIPWLNRELIALLTDSESQVIFVLELILALIMRYDIKSPEFYVHIEPYLQNRTTHFIHEFYNFARSPYDMVNYDRRAVYECLEPNNCNENFSPVSSTTSDIIVIHPVNSSENSASVSQLDRHTKDRQSDFSSTHSTSQNNSNLKQIFWNSDESWMNKESSNSIIFSPLNNPQHDLESGLPGPSTSTHCSIPETQTSNIEKKEENISTDKESDSDCMVIGYVKPRSERTPELIDLVSSSSDTEIENYNMNVIRKSCVDDLDDKRYLRKKLTFHERDYYRPSSPAYSEKHHSRHSSWSPPESSSSNSKQALKGECSKKREKKVKSYKYYSKRAQKDPSYHSSTDTEASDSDDSSTDYSGDSTFRLCSVVGKTSTIKFYKTVSSGSSSHRKKHKKQKRKKHRKHKHHHKRKRYSSSSERF